MTMTLPQKLKDKISIVVSLVSVKFIKYAIVGVLALAADYFVFLNLYYHVGSGVIVATVLSQVSGLLISYALNRFWTFHRTNKKPALRQFAKLGMLFIFNTIFSYIAIAALIYYEAPAYLAKLFTIGCIVTWNYFIYKKSIF